MADNDLKLRLDFDINPMEEGLDEADARLRQSFKFLGKASTDLTKKWKDVAVKAEKNWKKMRLNTDMEAREIRNLNEAVTVTGKQVEWLSRIQARAATEDIARTKERLRAYGDWGNEIVKVMESQRKEGESELQVLSKITKEMKDSTETAKESLNELRRAAFGDNSVMIHDAIQQLEQEAKQARDSMTKSYFTYKAGADIGEAAKEAISSISARDMKGVAGGLLKGLGAGIKGAGAGMSRWGAKKKEDVAAGGMGKAMGVVAGKLGGMVGTFAKMLPMIQATAGIFLTIVKTLIDAESAAKEFNKELLEGGSTAEFLAHRGGDANGAFMDLKDTVDEIRNASMDASENLAWGINKKTHLEFLTTLKAEGHSLNRIKTEAEAAGKATGDFAADMVHVGVAYSRNFGVSLSEIASFQSDMTRDMGMNLDSTRDAFAMMQTAATESTIASNKFFAIMRSMSADLSLFNLRMEDAASTLKLLGKVMSPKNAEQFLKTITSFYKGQDLMSRVKATAIAGVGGTKARLQKDVDARITSIKGEAKKVLGEGADKDIETAVRKGPEAMAEIFVKYQSQFATEGGGALKGAIFEANRMQGKLTQGGLISVASALKDASPVSTIEHLDAIARKAGAKTGMDDLQDVQIAAFTQMAQMGDEQIDQAVQLKMGLDVMKAELSARLKDGSQLSKEQQQLLANLGIKQGDANALAAVEGTDMRTLWASMSKLQQKELQGTAKAEDYAKQQGELTQDLMGKLDVIADYLLNLVYRGIMLVLDAMPLASKQQEAAKIQMSVMKSKNKDLINAFNDSKNMGEFHGKALTETSVGKQTASILMNASAEIEALNKKSEEQVRIQNDPQKSEAEKTAAGKELVRLAKEKDAKAAAQQDIIKDMQANLGKSSKNDQGIMMAEAMYDAIRSGLIQKPKLGTTDAAVGHLYEGANWQDALTKAGFNEEEIGKIMGKALWKLSPEQVAGVLGNQAKRGAAPTTGEKPPSPQTQASAPSGTSPAAAPGAPAPGQPPATRTGQTVAAPPGALDAKQPPAVKETAEAAAETASSSQETADLLAAMNSKNGEIVKVLLGRTGMGVALGAPKGDGYGKDIEKSVLKAVQQGLFEYWIYKDDKVDKAHLKSISDFGGGKFSAEGNLKRIQKWVKDEAGVDMQLPDTATGGSVVGTSGGLAKIVRPAPGEGLASVGKGERIVPAGGGGGGTIKVELAFKDGMEKFVEAKVIDTNYEHTRRSRTS